MTKFRPIILFIIAMVGFLGLSFLVETRIESKLAGLDSRMAETIQTNIEKEMSDWKQANIIRKSVEKKSRQDMEAVKKLNNAVSQIKAQIAQLEDGISDIGENLYIQNDKVRKDAQLLVQSAVGRIRNLEKAVDGLSQNFNKIEYIEIKEDFKGNAWYEVQITYDPGSEPIAKHLGKVLQDKGFRISTWSNIRKIEKIYGVPIESLENTISILPAPGENAIGEKIAKILHEEEGVPVVRTGVDNAGNSRPTLVGLLIPPGYQLSEKLFSLNTEVIPVP